MTDPMQLLRAANPVSECEPPEFERLLERLDGAEGRGEPVSEGRRGRLFGLRSKKAPHQRPGPAPRHSSDTVARRGRGRGILSALAPVAVALTVGVVALVSLHGTGTHAPGRVDAHGGGPTQTTASSSGSMAYAPGEARGRVVIGSMHPFDVAASGAAGQTWGAEWFRTTAGQICVQASREVGGRLGYVNIDGIVPADGRFHPWAANTAVDARCIAQPVHGGVALMVAEQVAGSGYPLTADGACTAAEHAPCPKRDTTTLFFGVLGSGAGMAAYGSGGHSEQAQSPGPGPDGEYVTAIADGGHVNCLSTTPCPSTAPERLVHRGSHAFVIYNGADRVCRLHGPGTDGVMSGDCPYGLTLGRSPNRLTEAEVSAPVGVTTRTTVRQVQLTARFHSPLPSSRVGGYSLQLSTPPSGCAGRAGGASSTSAAFGGSGQQRFAVGALITEAVTVPRCTGLYHGAVLVQPLVGSPLVVGRFTFRAPHR